MSKHSTRPVLVVAWCLSIGAGAALSQAVLSPPAQTSTSYRPLRPGQRWRLYWHDTLLSPSLYLASLGSAAAAQTRHEPPEWGQGVEGYAKRSASLLGIFTLEETIHQGGEAALGYDPRYLPCSCTGFFRRSGHAILGSLLTKNAAGSTRIDFPTLAGAYGSGMLSTYWYPARYEPLKDGFRVGSRQMGGIAIVNFVKEFAPELKRFARFK